MTKHNAKMRKPEQTVRCYCFPVIVRKTSKTEATRLRELFEADHLLAATSAAIFFKNRFAVPAVPMR